MDGTIKHEDNFFERHFKHGGMIPIKFMKSHLEWQVHVVRFKDRPQAIAVFVRGAQRPSARSEHPGADGTVAAWQGRCGDVL